MSEYAIRRFKEYKLPVSVQLQGPIEEDPDKYIIAKIIKMMREASPLIQTGNCKMIIKAPPCCFYFKHFKGKDFQILITTFSKSILLHIKELTKYEDVAWGMLDGENSLPPGMAERLKEKSGII